MYNTPIIIRVVSLHAGNTSDGFVMQAGNKYVMEFFVPRKTESSYIQNAELWIFPHSIVRPEGRFQRMSLLISAELEHASRPRKEVLDIIWDTRKDCIALNLTSLSRKISRNLVKNQLEQANISVSVELVSRSRQPHPTTDHIIDKCSAVAEKQSKNPFLVVKYFVEKPVDLSTLTSRQRKSATVPTTTSQNCSLVPLNANLTKIFGDSLLFPKVLDISDCYGSCNLLKNRNDFTIHAFLAETIKQTDVNAPLYTRKTSCVPVQYKPEYVLFTEDKKMFILVLFDNMIVTECGCR